MTTSEPVDEAAVAAAAEAAKAELAADWGKYIATDPIFIGGARAFNPGDAVPASHVTSGVVDASQVTEVTPEQPAAAVPEATPVPEIPAAVEEN